MTPTRPVMRYHGGKWRLAPWIISHFPAHRVYVEPYCGAASVLMRKPRSYAEVINDLDGEIVNVFRVLRDPKRAKRLEGLLRLTPFAREEFDLSYKPCKNTVEQARRTIVRAFAGFGSNAHNRVTGFRSCSNRSGTTPAHDWMHFPACVEAFTERLAGVVVERRDALTLAAQHDSPETLWYVDPPYVLSTRTDAAPDYKYELSDTDHERLAGALHDIQGMVLLSAYPSPLYDELYKGWRCVQRHTAEGAKHRTECLWLNPAAANAVQPRLIAIEEVMR